MALPFYHIFYAVTSVAAGCFLFFFWVLLVFSDYFRSHQRHFYQAITLFFMVLVIMSFGAKVESEESTLKPKRSETVSTLASILGAANLAIEVATSFLLIDTQITRFQEFYKSFRYRCLLLIGICLNLPCPSLAFISEQLTTFFILLFTTNNAAWFYCAHRASSTWVQEANEKDAPLDEKMLLEEIQTTARILSKYTCYRMVLRFANALLLWAHPESFFIPGVITLLEAFLFVAILLNHQHSCYRFYTWELARYEAVHGGHPRPDIKLEFPPRSPRYPNVKMIIWKTDESGTRKVKYTEPINWARLDDYDLV